MERQTKRTACLLLAACLAILLSAAVAYACEGDTKRTKTIISPLTGKAYVVLEMSDEKTVLEEMADKDMKRVSTETWGMVGKSGSVDKAADAYKGALNPDTDFRMENSEPADRAATKEAYSVGKGTGQAAPSGN